MTAKPHVLRIAYPIPLPVLGVLMQLLQAVWPDGHIDNTDPAYLKVHLVGRKARVPGRRTLQRLADETVPVDGGDAQQLVDDMDAHLAGFNPDGTAVIASSSTEAQLMLGEWALRVLDDHPDAINYVEWEVQGPDGRRVVLCAARSRGQTPAALREAADRRIAELEAELAQLRRAGTP